MNTENGNPIYIVYILHQHVLQIETSTKYNMVQRRQTLQPFLVRKKRGFIPVTYVQFNQVIKDSTARSGHVLALF